MKLRLSVLALLCVVVACGGRSGGAKPFAYSVDTTIRPQPESIEDLGQGSRPLAVAVDDDGIASTFVANEVQIAPKDRAEFEAFLLRYGGEVVGTNAIPEPPPGVERRDISSAADETWYLVKLDPSAFGLQNLAADAARLDIGGRHRFSSEAAARMIALVAHERLAGAAVDLNFVAQSQGYLYSTTEQRDWAGVSDAFRWQEFGSSGSKSNVTKAWQFALARGIERRVKVAILDSGFWLNGAGQPFTDSQGRSDLPANPIQYNFAADSYLAGGMNLNSCKGGPCPWHGNGAASVAAAALNNGAGAAGTGGLVADPMLFNIAITDDQVARAVRTAVSWGADIISMSFSGECNTWCRFSRRPASSYAHAFQSARWFQLLLVAAAGNEGVNVSEEHFQPCERDGVFCVGALNDGQIYSYRDSNWASNWGSAVSIWAPTNIHRMPDGNNPGTLTKFSGTSASCPFVAGVAALALAMDRNLKGDAAREILARTAWKDSPHEVTAYVNAYAAVVAAAGGYHLAPDLQITAPADRSSITPTGGFYVAQFSGRAIDVDDGPLAIAWSSDRDGDLGQGDSVLHDFTSLSEGDRRITATATNRAGVTARATITLRLSFLHIPPTPVITQPQPNTTVAPGAYLLQGRALSTDPGAVGRWTPCDKLVWTSRVRQGSTWGPPADGTPIVSTRSASYDSTGLCEAQVSFAGVGIRQIELAATNRLGDRGTAAVELNVASVPDLTVQILNPIWGQTFTVWIRGSVMNSIALRGTINQAGGRYAWYWYRAGSPVSSKVLIANGSSASWDPLASALCPDPGTEHVVIRLEASIPIEGRSGVAEVPIHLNCTLVPH